MIFSKARREIFIMGALLAAITLALYSPVAHFDFINFDDPDYVTLNWHVHEGLTWSGIAWAFQTGYTGNWHPLTWVSHMLDYQFFGLNASGHHLENLCWHITNTLLLFLFLIQTTGKRWASVFVAALFAWHPLHVESVAWISERKDVLSTFFWLSTLLAYVRYVSKTGAATYLLTLLLFAMGLMTKPMLVTLPCVLLLLDYWPLGRWSSISAESISVSDTVSRLKTPMPALLWEKAPFFALTLAASVATFLAQTASGAVSSLNNIPLSSRIANAVQVYFRYILKTFWPVDLAVMYPFRTHLAISLTVAAAVALVLCSGLLLIQARRCPGPLVGWLWYLGTLVPTIGLVQVGAQSMADRYMYIPSIGLFILIAWETDHALRNWRFGQQILWMAGGFALVGCIGCTWIQLKNWENAEILFRHAIQVTTDNYIADRFLGVALQAHGREDQAILLYQKSIRLNPHYSASRCNLGQVLLHQGKLEEAIQELTLAVNEDPASADAQNSLGVAFLKQGNLSEAETHLLKAIQLDPHNPTTYFNLGTLYIHASRTQDAIIQFQRALELRPDYGDAHGNLGVQLASMGRPGDAAIHFAEAVRLDPASAQARFNFGLALLELNRFSEAEIQFIERLRLGPEDAGAHYHLALALNHQHKRADAIIHLRMALRLSPDFPEALSELAWALTTDPAADPADAQEAIQLAQHACELTDHRQPAPLLALSAACGRMGRYSDAMLAAQQAKSLAETAGQKELLEKIGVMQQQYESGHPFVETP